MTYPIPNRTTADTAQSHVDDHNEIHSSLGAGLPVVTIGSTGHLAHHKKIHLILNTIRAQSLPTTIAAGNTGHVGHHNTIGALLNTERPGIRGVWGPQTSSANLPGYPTSFDGTIGAGGTWATFTAFNAAGGGVTNGKYKVMGTHTSPPAVTVKAGQEFWGDPANPATLSFPAGTGAMFRDGGSNKAGVKIQNMTIVGFVKALTCNASGGWDIGYLDMSAGNGDALIAVNQQSQTPVHRIHHTKIHDTYNPIWHYQTTVGTSVEDCEIYDIITHPTDGAYKAGVGTWYVQYKHCWFHGNDRGIWFDYWNGGTVIEWCRFSDNDYAAIELEANPGVTGLGDAGGLWLLTLGGEPNPYGTVIRYNRFENNGHLALMVHGSASVEAYGNIMYRNQPLAQAGLNDGEFQLYINNAVMRVNQRSDLAENSFHHNFVELTPTIAGHQPKRGVTMQTDSDVTDAINYTNNSKNNDFDFNVYILNRATGSTDTFYWNSNKSFATWQALPQDASGSASAS